MRYLVTFYTHYGAQLFQRYCQNRGVTAKMMPVPRKLSASCGVCICFESLCAPSAAEHEDMEGCYIIAPDGGYEAVLNRSE